MPDRHRSAADTVVKVVTALILLFLWSLLIWDLAARNTQYDKDADHYATAYAEKAQKDLEEACPGSDVQSVATCVAGYIEAQRNAYRDEHDLKAQQKMADWALGMLIVSALTLSATAIGAYFVWRSLRQTREAISNDREIGHAQVRAYLTVSTAPLFEDFVPNKTLGFRLEIRNAGQSPAKDVTYKTLLFTAPPLANWQNIEGSGGIGNGKEQGTHQRTSIAIGDKVLNYGEITLDEDQFSVVVTGLFNLYIACIVSYRDVFDKGHFVKSLEALSQAASDIPLANGEVRRQYGISRVPGFYEAD